jgi:hypothetical protein
MSETGPTGQIEEPSEKVPDLETQIRVYSDIYKEHGIEIDSERVMQQAKELQEEMAKQDGSEDFQMLVYVPEGLTTQDATQIAHVRVGDQIDWDLLKNYFLTSDGVPKDEGLEVVGFARFSKDPGITKDGKFQKPLGGEIKPQVISGTNIETPRLAMIQQLAFNRMTGQQMNESHSTIFPRSRFEKTFPPQKGHSLGTKETRLPYLSYQGGQVYFNAYYISDNFDHANSEGAVRQIFTKRMRIDKYS